jgi:A/G-specific adenine glycosylase
MPKIDFTIIELTPKIFHKIVLNWFDIHGRKSLPWQFNKTPYRVWISEIMLQQTQVSTVIPYFLRFMETFPDVETLSCASEDAVLHLWTGLGYYSRARNLHKSAKEIVSRFRGIFPSDLEALESLPGIGRSTAGAILAIAFEKNTPILDGNVKRVLVRLHGIDVWPGEKNALDKLWCFAEKFTPSERCGDYTQAMMDLGATVCVRGVPKCGECPLQNYCMAYQQGNAANLPKKKPSLKIPTRAVTLLVIKNSHQHVLLEKRSAKGVWRGLWSMPEMPANSSAVEIKTLCQQRFQYRVKDIKFGAEFRHTFSHYHLNITPAFISIADSSGKVMEADQQIWYNLEQPNNVGLPAPVKNLLRELSACPES